MGLRAQRGNASAMVARMPVVRALSAAGRFKVTRPAALLVAMRTGSPAVAPESELSGLLSSTGCSCCFRSTFVILTPDTIRGIYDSCESAETGSGCGGVRFRDLGLTRGVDLHVYQMFGDGGGRLPG